MKILNYGSLNIDHVYQVDHISRPGETLSSRSYQVFAGGKGANQSAALALAGAPVFHAGQVGPEGRWLLEKLGDLGADMRYTRVAETPTGHAIIQVDSQGQNSIVLYPGANHSLDIASIDATFEQFDRDDILLLQNEINEIPHLIEKASESGLRICFNPAPFAPEILDYPLDRVDILVVNETEGMGLAGMGATEGLLDALSDQWPRTEILLTLGAEGSLYRGTEISLKIPAQKVTAVDTTAAGDTYIGFFLAGLAAGRPVEEALRVATRAAAVCVTRPGAMDSIPSLSEVEAMP